jgi:hypothetical protein
MRVRSFAVLFVASASLFATTDMSSAAGFDGSWSVKQVCPKAKDGAFAYSWSYVANVKDGVLDASYTAAKGSIHLHGAINADGAAELTADGRTGPPEYAVGHVAEGSPVHYHVRARFEPTRGSGERVEQRQCSFTFTKTH